MTCLSESILEWGSLVGSIFLTRSLLNHPSLMSWRSADLATHLTGKQKQGIRRTRTHTQAHVHARERRRGAGSAWHTHGHRGTRTRTGCDDDTSAVMFDFSFEIRRESRRSWAVPGPANSLKAASGDYLELLLCGKFALPRIGCRAPKFLLSEAAILLGAVASRVPGYGWPIPAYIDKSSGEAIAGSAISFPGKFEGDAFFLPPPFPRT
jgi:hypothetical protein